MQITDYSHQPTVIAKKSSIPGQMTAEAITAALFFLVPALLLFVLSAH